jgi:RNA polymerase sigma-70 factor (ECF subfamily)
MLIQACLRRDESAWEAVVQSQGRRIFNLCLRFTACREEAEDLTQEIFVRIYRSLKSFRSDSGSFQCWILSVARNLLIDHYRKMRRFQPPIGTEEMETMHLEDQTTLSPSRALEQAEAARLLTKALVELSPDLRTALILRDLEGMSYQQVAKFMGVSEGTVKSRIFRARLRLAQVFSESSFFTGNFRKPVSLVGFERQRAMSPIPHTAAYPI